MHEIVNIAFDYTLVVMVLFLLGDAVSAFIRGRDKHCKLDFLDLYFEESKVTVYLVTPATFLAIIVTLTVWEAVS